MIISITPYYTGQVNQYITRWKLLCTDSLAVVTAAGYLNAENLMGYTMSPLDIIDCQYGFTGNASSYGTGTYVELLPTISHSNGTALITLNEVSGSGVPVSVANDIVIFSNATGGLADSGILISNAVLKNAANAMAAGSSIVLAKVNGTEAANAVTANGVAGVITTSSLTTAGAGTYAITWTNSFITATSVIGLTIQGGTNTTQNINFKVVPGTGTATLTIYNLTAATALNGTIFIGYSVL